MNGKLKLIGITQGMAKLSLTSRYLSSSMGVETLHKETHSRWCARGQITGIKPSHRSERAEGTTGKA